jgi:hypothetical protein
MKYSIVDNFLDKEDFLQIKYLLENPKFNWFYREYMAGEKDAPYFSHGFFNHSEKISPSFKIIQPLLNKLKYIALVQVRANLTLKTDQPIETAWHTDYNYSNGKTAIYYLTTCNGLTVLDKEEKIKVNSVENRVVVFDNNISHKSVTHTDTKRRIILNINYFDEQ